MFCSRLLPIFLAVVNHCVFSSERLRGVSVARASFYQFGVPFTCLDGSATISWLKVNDDYCDCRDASDEPGTAACSNGHFYCKDIQYKSLAISSSFVNDGVCDCCDGSDEYNNLTTCVSTCSALAASLREARSMKRNQIEKGHKLCHEYLENLRTRREQEAVEAEKFAREQEVAEVQTTSPPDHLPDPDLPEVNTNIRTPSDQDSVLPVPDGVANKPDVENDESLSGHADHSDVDSDQNQSHDLPPPPTEPVHIPIDFGPDEVFQMLTELPEECIELDDREYTYSLCPFKSVHQRSKGSSNTDRGTLIGSWSRWLQDDSSDSLYEAMLYDHGAGCWNGPSRSTKVFVHCGDENRLTSVDEPSRCEYVMHMFTPAACYEDPDIIFNRLHPEL